MLGNLFKKPEDDEKRQMVEGMQSMSEQIGALSKQLADKNAEIEQLQQATSGAAANATTLDAAKKEMDALQQQIHNCNASWLRSRPRTRPTRWPTS